MLFACIFVPDFAVEAVVRAEPELRTEAVAILDGTPPLMRVVAANEAARTAGIDIGMARMQAESKVTGLALRRRSRVLENAAHAALFDCACGFSPRVEASPLTPDTVVLDLDGLERLFGPPPQLAREIARRASAVGLEVNLALAGNIETAWLAAHGLPGLSIVPTSQERERLGTLPVDVLLSCAPGSLAQTFSAVRNSTKTLAGAAEMIETLDRWGIRRLRDLAALPETAVQQRLGDAGLRWQKLARGEGSRPLVPSEPPQKFEEAAELEHPIALLEPLAFLLNRMLEQLCARLSARAFATRQLTLQLALVPAADPDALQGTAHGDDRLHVITLRTPVPMVEPKVFLKLLQLELRVKPPGAPVERLFLSAEPLPPRFTQGGLFLPTAPEPEKLALMLARIAAVVKASTQPEGTQPETKNSGAQLCPRSDDAERVGSPEPLDTHRPDAFRMKTFSPPAPASPNPPRPATSAGAVALNGEQAEAQEAAIPRAGLRRFRPPLALEVTLRDGNPVRIKPATIDSVNLDRQIAGGNCIWAAGPWHESGDWWGPDGWSHEVWDVAVETSRPSPNEHARKAETITVLYRIYRDAIQNSWFLEAMYD